MTFLKSTCGNRIGSNSKAVSKNTSFLTAFAVHFQIVIRNLARISAIQFILITVTFSLMVHAPRNHQRTSIEMLRKCNFFVKRIFSYAIVVVVIFTCAC
jgi:hypothetical protein